MAAKKKEQKKQQKRPRATGSTEAATFDFIAGLVELTFGAEVNPAAVDPSTRQRRGQLVAETMIFDFLRTKYDLLRADPIFSTDPPEETTRFFTLYFPESTNLLALLEDLRGKSEVERASLVPKLFPSGDPIKEPYVGSGDVIEEPAKQNQWYIYRSLIDKAWKVSDPQDAARGVSGDGVIMAAIDWGVRTSHEDFKTADSKSRILKTYNSITGKPDVTKGAKIQHGTAVLGQVGAAVNSSGIAGIAYEADLWAIQAADTPETALPVYWKKAIEYVWKEVAGNKRKVVLLEVQSEKGGCADMYLEINMEIRKAIAKNIIVCMPAGNGDRDAGKDLKGIKFQPSGAIVVGATSVQADNSRAKFKGSQASNWGDSVVISAPGDEDYDVSCGNRNDDDYIPALGKTSGAAAKVAGVIALMLQANPALGIDDIKDIFRKKGSPVKTESGKPVGVFLDAYAFVGEARRRHPSLASATRKRHPAIDSKED